MRSQPNVGADADGFLCSGTADNAADAQRILDLDTKRSPCHRIGLSGGGKDSRLVSPEVSASPLGHQLATLPPPLEPLLVRLWSSRTAAHYRKRDHARPRSALASPSRPSPKP